MIICMYVFFYASKYIVDSHCYNLLRYNYMNTSDNKIIDICLNNDSSCLMSWKYNIHYLFKHLIAMTSTGNRCRLLQWRQQRWRLHCCRSGEKTRRRPKWSALHSGKRVSKLLYRKILITINNPQVTPPA